MDVVCNICYKIYCKEHACLTKPKIAWPAYVCIYCKKGELLDIKCKQCSKNTCIEHISPDDHNCTANFIKSKNKSKWANNRVAPTPTTKRIAIKTHKKCIIS